MTTKMKSIPSLRFINRGDLDQVIEIERMSHEDEPDQAWCADDWDRNLSQRNSFGVVASDSRRAVIGVMLYELTRSRIEIVRMLISPKRRREGVGMRMIGTLQRKIMCGNRDEVSWSVPEQCLELQQFLRACGWKARWVRNGVIRFEFDARSVGDLVLRQVLNGDGRTIG